MKFKKQYVFFLALAAILLTGFYFRTAGLYRGLEEGYIFHPDSPKQVKALSHYLKGEYIWYTGSWFYDGYPLFLNHVDELVIRCSSALIQPIKKYLTPDAGEPFCPGGMRLYYWARSLRVIYGMISLVLSFAIARGIGLSRRGSLFTMALVALAPVSSAVTHAATGDVGVDMFTAGVLAILAAHTRHQKKIIFFLAGVLAAFAFATKYQGALVCIPIAIYAISMTLLKRMSPGILLQSGMLTILGFIVGTTVAIPQLVWATERTWTDMATNFTRIKSYNVPAEILNQPMHYKAAYSFKKNVPILAQNLGILFSITAVAGVFVLLFKGYHKSEIKGERKAATFSFNLAILSFPILAIIPSLAFKPEVQPFHFSFLIIPLAVAATFFLERTYSSKKTSFSILSIILAIALVIELSSIMNKELFFWKRQDIKAMSDKFLTTVFDHNAYAFGRPYSSQSRWRQTIRDFHLENNNPAVFRNLRLPIRINSGFFWNTLNVAPAPCTPLPFENHWIFTEGPLFPVNDRMFVANADKVSKKHIVYFSTPELITVGLRSGAIPTAGMIECGGTRKHFKMEPDAMRIVTFKNPEYRRTARRKNGYVFLVPLKVEPVSGKAYVSILPSDDEICHFKVFSGNSSNTECFSYPAWVDIDISKHLAQTEFIQSEKEFCRVLSEDETFSFFKTEQALPCGIYRLLINCLPTAAPSRIRIKLSDKRNMAELQDTAQIINIEPGADTIEYIFLKTFAPYECNINITCLKGNICVESWRLKPDFEKILTDIRLIKSSENKPQWLARFHPGTTRKKISPDINLNFNNGITILSADIPEQVHQNEFLDIYLLGETVNIKRIDWNQNSVVLRFCPPSGGTAGAINIPVKFLNYSRKSAIPFKAKLPDSIAEGEYNVLLGMINIRTLEKYSTNSKSLFKKGKAWINIGKLKVTSNQDKSFY